MDQFALTAFKMIEEFKEIYDSDETDESSSNSSDEENTAILNFAEEIVPSYTNLVFKSHFRLDIATFNKLCRLIHDSSHHEIHPGRPEIPTEKQVMLTLWFFGNREPFR